jgi:redox-regulated HSP33 family molecular chaperone
MKTLRCKIGVLGLFLSAIVLLGSGCRDKKPSSEVLTLEGTVEKVTAKADGTGEIVVRYYSEKHQKELEGVGRVTRETQILVNGQAASLSDIKPGEPVTGKVRVEKKGKVKNLTVLEVQVDRGPTQGD